MRRYKDAEALAERIGVSAQEVVCRALPWRERGVRCVLVLGLGWVSVIDSEAEILGLKVTPIGPSACSTSLIFVAHKPGS